MISTLERIGRRRERARLRDDLPHLEAAIDVAAEDRCDVRERAALDDRARTIAHFLGRLKDDEHVASRRRSRVADAQPPTAHDA